MPKHSNKIDYTKTPISFYRFVCNDENITSCYVGHTANFRTRKAQHKSNCYNENCKEYNKKLYVLMRENGGFNNWNMIEIVSKLCLSKRDAERQEQVYIDELQATINAVKSFAYKKWSDDHKEYYKQYREAHKQKSTEYAKQYYQDNRQRILTQTKQSQAKKREIAEYHKHLSKQEEEAEHLYEQQRIIEILNEDDDDDESE
jgi:hypothetical protein